MPCSATAPFALPIIHSCSGAGLRAEPSRQLPRAPNYKGHLNITGISGKYKYIKNISLKGPELLACLGPDCSSGYAGKNVLL
jgi:hypothetical protein